MKNRPKLPNEIPAQSIPHQIGLYQKYILDGEKDGNYFVLKPERDYAALQALKAYTGATVNRKLKADLFNWIMQIESDVCFCPCCLASVELVKTPDAIFYQCPRCNVRGPDSDSVDDATDIWNELFNW